MSTINQELNKGKSSFVRLSKGGPPYATNYQAAIGYICTELYYALINDRADEVKEYIEIIESWKNGNEEERKAYAAFMWGPYKKLYKEARRYLKEKRIISV